RGGRARPTAPGRARDRAAAGASGRTARRGRPAWGSARTPGRTGGQVRPGVAGRAGELGDGEPTTGVEKAPPGCGRDRVRRGAGAPRGPAGEDLVEHGEPRRPAGGGGQPPGQLVGEPAEEVV